MRKQSVILAFIWLMILVALAKDSPHATPNLRSSENQLIVSNDGLLEFQNKTGKCFGSSQLNTFVNFINQASTKYRSDFKSNLKYIQENMEAAFGTQTQKYNIFIQGDYEYQTEYLIYPIGDSGCNYAALNGGINMINPHWSYLIVKNSYATYSPSFQYVGQISKGSGVTLEKKKQIDSIIVAVQIKQFSCLCGGLTTMAKNIKTQDGQDWAIICQTGSATYSYIAAKKQQWIYTKPAECNYLLYVQ